MMPYRTLPVLRLTGVATCLLLALILWSATVAAQSPSASLGEEVQDFGTVMQGEVASATFVLRNQGLAPLIVESAQASEAGMKIRLRREIPPGGQGEVILELDTSGLSGPAEASATLSLNDPKRPEITFLLKGRIEPAIEFQPMRAVYFSLFNGESATKSVTIRINRDQPLLITGLVPTGEHFLAEVATVESGRVYRLDVTVPPETPVGRYREGVFLQTDDPVYSRLGVAVNVLVKADLHVSPEVVDLGAIDLARLRHDPSLLGLLESFAMLKRRQGTFALTSVETDVPFLRVTPDPAGPSQIFRLDLVPALKGMERGNIDGSIRIQTDDPEYPEIVIPVRGEIR
jgi:hypothetical protein